MAKKRHSPLLFRICLHMGMDKNRSLVLRRTRSLLFRPRRGKQTLPQDPPLHARTTSLADTLWGTKYTRYATKIAYV